MSLKKRMHFINVLLTKWLTVDKLNNQEIGHKVRQWYWKNEKITEHWINEDSEPEDPIDYMYGGGDDVDSRMGDDVEDEIY